MWVKICGTTSLADAQLAAKAGADAVGFVFAPSKRRVNAEQVASITVGLPETLEKIGVFHTADVDEIATDARQAGLTGVQLHFPHNAMMSASLRATLGTEFKLLQVISCPVEGFDEGAFRAEVAAAITDTNLWGILLDASAKGVSGGTGMSFNWKHAAAVLANIWPQRLSGQGPKLVLAGGLRQENVREAILQLQPFGVDVVSGVEASPGVKDPQRVTAFVEEGMLAHAENNKAR